MQRTYLFYDIETTGLNKCFDQILQFAAIRTDLNLNEIDRHEIWIKLNKDIIPSPEAVIIHRIDIDKLNDCLNEYEAIQQIYELINTPGTISIGYNSLTFDDEFLRFSFYRNLLPPYTHQYANDCGRMDIYPMMVMYYLFKPDVLTWPNIAGKTSLKLENLAAANGFNRGTAHNALVDVEATLTLAKILKQEDAMWHYVCGYFDKKIDLERMKQLDNAFLNYKIALYVFGKIGSQKNYIAPVLKLGQHYHYKNQTIWLRLDNDVLTQTQADNIPETSNSFNKKAGEPGFLLPNKDRFQVQISEKRQVVVARNLKWLEKNPDKLTAIAEYYKDFKYPTVPNVDSEAELYNIGFYSNSEKDYCQQFHQANINRKISMLEETNNTNIQELAFRILGKHYYDQLSKKLQKEFHEYLAKTNPVNDQVIVDYRGDKRLTAIEALKEIHELKNFTQLDTEQQTLLDNLEIYCQRFSSHINTFN